MMFGGTAIGRDIWDEDKEVRKGKNYQPGINCR